MTPVDFLAVVVEKHPWVVALLAKRGIDDYPEMAVSTIAAYVKFPTPPDGSLAAPYLQALLEHLDYFDSFGVKKTSKIRKKKAPQDRLERYKDGGSW